MERSRKRGGALNYPNIFAGIAQLVVQLICNQQVGGSDPSTSAKNPSSWTIVKWSHPVDVRGSEGTIYRGIV